MIPVLLATALLAGAPQGEAAAAAIEVNLARTYKAGESQTYIHEMGMTLPGMDEKITMSGEVTWKIAETTPKGAKVESSFRDVKMMFGGEDAPLDDQPKNQTLEWDVFGLPAGYGTEAATDDENPISGIEIFCILPNQRIALGKEFKFTWNSDETRVEGTGKLIATGMLYEEHVAKVSMELTESPKNDVSGKYEYTAYFNTENGKLVKAEGTYVTESEEMGGKLTADFVFKKVRDK
jgi:hypothetical protein